MRRSISFVLLIIGLMMLCIPTTYAAMEANFACEPVYGEEKTEHIDSLEIIYDDEVAYSGKIGCFDVREDGYIAVGSMSDTLTERGLWRKQIAVFSPEGILLRSFTFIDYGSYEIDWYGDNILVYCVRRDIIFSVSITTDSIDIYRLSDNPHDQVWETFHEESTIVDGWEYSTEHTFGLTKTTSHIIRTDKNGSSETVVSTTNKNMLFIVPIAIAAVVFVGPSIGSSGYTRK